MNTFTYLRFCTAISWLLHILPTMAQIVSPSNGTQDLYPSSTSPRFLLNGTQFPNMPAIRLAPLGEYAEISHDSFVKVDVEGHLVHIDSSNYKEWWNQDEFLYISCDPEAYNQTIDASFIFRTLVNIPRTNIIILYSVTSNHCIVKDLDKAPPIGGILTTTDTMVASTLAGLNLIEDAPGDCTILPDLNSYTNSSGGHDYNNNGGTWGQSPTTAVAMIVLYSITGLITALFVAIIILGAIRAHRHPERYGPRAGAGRGRQSRAKGIARAMLETLPIVKFGDHESDKKASDMEMNANSKPDTSTTKTPTLVVGETTLQEDSTTIQAEPSAPNADGRDDEGQLGCSICTEDFTRGEEVRVLPCNHKFHPDCVDPWLLNVSGTCPLCRIDLRPTEDPTNQTATNENPGSNLPPPLEGNIPIAQAGRRDTITSLRQIAGGTREERIAALRRHRQQRRSSYRASEDERRGLARRFRERFRITTERRESVIVETEPATMEEGVAQERR